MMGTKSSSTSRATFWESVTPSYRRTATYIALAYLLHMEGRDDRPRLKLYNAATLASIGTQRITQMSDIRNFLGELLPRTYTRSSQKAPGASAHFLCALPAFSAFERVGESKFEPLTTSGSRLPNTLPYLSQVYTIPTR